MSDGFEQFLEVFNRIAGDEHKMTSDDFCEDLRDHLGQVYIDHQTKTKVSPTTTEYKDLEKGTIDIVPGRYVINEDCYVSVQFDDGLLSDSPDEQLFEAWVRGSGDYSELFPDYWSDEPVRKIKEAEVLQIIEKLLDSL